MTDVQDYTSFPRKRESRSQNWTPAFAGVTASKDAHVIAANFDAAIEAMQAAGLKYVTLFEKREAGLVRI